MELPLDFAVEPGIGGGGTDDCGSIAVLPIGDGPPSPELMPLLPIELPCGMLSTEGVTGLNPELAGMPL